MIRLAKQHRWLILTKRIERVVDSLPSDWGEGWPHVWIGTSVENQARADERLPILASLPSLYKFISAEPLLGPIFIRPYLAAIHLVIVGGESGPKARRISPEWGEAVRQQCEEAGVIFHFQQMGGETKVNDVWGGDRLNGQRYLALPDWWMDEGPPAEQLSFL